MPANFVKAKIRRYSMIRRVKETFLGIAVRAYRLSINRSVEHEHAMYQAPTVPVSCLDLGSVILVPSNSPPELFERSAGILPDPIFEASLQLSIRKDYYEGRVTFGPDGLPMYAVRLSGTDVSTGTSAGDDVDSEQLQLSPAAAYARTQTRRLGLNQDRYMVENGRHIGDDSTQSLDAPLTQRQLECRTAQGWACDGASRYGARRAREALRAVNPDIDVYGGKPSQLAKASSIGKAKVQISNFAIVSRLSLERSA